MFVDRDAKETNSPFIRENDSKTLKLSEAIRIGCRLTPQIKERSRYFECGGTCAVGAAAVGLYGLDVAGKPDKYWFDPMVKMYGNKAIDAAIDLFYTLPNREDVADKLEARGW